MEMVEVNSMGGVEVSVMGYVAYYRLSVERRVQRLGGGVKRELLHGAVEKIGRRDGVSFHERFHETPLLYRGAGRYYVYLGVRQLLLSLDDDGLPQWEGVYSLKLEARDVSPLEVAALPSMEPVADLYYGRWL